MTITLMEVYQSMKEMKENLTKDNDIGDGDREQTERKLMAWNHQTLVIVVDTAGVSAKLIMVSLSDFLIHRGEFQQPHFHHVSAFLSQS